MLQKRNSMNVFSFFAMKDSTEWHGNDMRTQGVIISRDHDSGFFCLSLQVAWQKRSLCRSYFDKTKLSESNALTKAQTLINSFTMFVFYWLINPITIVKNTSIRNCDFQYCTWEWAASAIKHCPLFSSGILWLCPHFCSTENDTQCHIPCLPLWTREEYGLIATSSPIISWL